MARTDPTEAAGTASGRYAPGLLVSPAQLASVLSRVLARLAAREPVTRTS